MTGLTVIELERLRVLIGEEVRAQVEPLVERLEQIGRDLAEISALTDMLTREELARLLRIDQRTLRRLVLEGAVPPPISLGERTVRWRRATIGAWLKDLESSLQERRSGASM